MNIKVYGPNFGKPYSNSVADKLKGAIAVMSYKLGIAHLPINYEILLGRTVNKHDNECRGWAHAHRARNKWTATVFVMREKNIDKMISTLAHELIHIKQFVKDGLDLETGHFKGRKWAARKDQSIYYDSPWEREAYGNEVALLEYYNRYMKRNG